MPPIERKASREAPDGRRLRIALPDPPLLVISDRRQAKLPLLAVAVACFRGGCRWFSLREKDLPAAERLDLLTELVALGRDFGAAVTVHDDLAAALAAGAAGIHLPSGRDPAEARRAMPAGLIGISAHGAIEARALRAGGSDYATLSPIYLTTSKPGYGPALGTAALVEAAAPVSEGAPPLPLVALGGIVDPARAAACRLAGAAGIAVMGEIMRSPDPQETIEALVRLYRS